MSSVIVRNQIMLACNNLEQIIDCFEVLYKKSSQIEREQLRSRFEDNTYAIEMMNRMDINIMENKRKKIMEKAKEENI